MLGLTQGPSQQMQLGEDTNAANNYQTYLTSQASQNNARTAANSQNYGNQLEYNANMANVGLGQNKLNTQHGQWEQAFGLASNFLNNLGLKGGSGYNGTGSVGGPEPTISANPIWSQQQIAQQINNQNANVDAQVASQTKGMQNSLAGRGFGSNSALAYALGQGYQGQGLQTKTANAQNTAWNAAQGNAQQVLSEQQAQEQQYANRQQEYNQRLGIGAEYMSPLVGLLGSGMSYG